MDLILSKDQFRVPSYVLRIPSHHQNIRRGWDSELRISRGSGASEVLEKFKDGNQNIQSFAKSAKKGQGIGGRSYRQAMVLLTLCGALAVARCQHVSVWTGSLWQLEGFLIIISGIFFLFCYYIYLLLVCEYVHVLMNESVPSHMHCIASVWKSQYNLRELLLFSCRFLSIKLRSQAWLLLSLPFDGPVNFIFAYLCLRLF